MEVTSCGPDFANTKVLAGGPLSNHKGVNLPNVMLDVSPLTEKDRRDLEFALEIGIGLIALSFVQRPEDVEEAQRLIAGRAHLISKLEKPSAINQLEEIVELTDSVMVARGDLGVELPPETVPANSETHHSLLPTSGQTGHCRHSDAGLHGYIPDADTGGSIRCCQCGIRRSRRGHVVSGDRGRRTSDSLRRHDG